MEMVPYGYSEEEQIQAQSIVVEYFEARKKEGGTIGSTPEDYFSLIRTAPSGENGKNYFSYLVRLIDKKGKEIPVAFFAGEKILENTVGMYSTITQRFPVHFKNEKWDMTGFTAIPQYIHLEIFRKLKESGVKMVHLGGSETEGLDIQKTQMGGEPQKTHWVVAD